MNEIWKDIRGYEGLYQVSNLGNVRSVKRGKLISIQSIPNGSKRVSLCKDGKLRSYALHRVVFESFHPEVIEDGRPYVIYFKDEDMSNCVPENLGADFCEVTADFNPEVSLKKGVLRPARTRGRMTKAKLKQSRESIDKGSVTRSESCQFRNMMKDRIEKCEYELNELKEILINRYKSLEKKW